MTKATVSIVMELDFDHVVDDERQLIKAEVAELIGCQVAELSGARFSRGCLKLEFEVDEELGEVFADLVKKAGAGEDVGEELAAIRRFMESRKVASVNLVRKSHLLLPREKQTAETDTENSRGDEPRQEIVLVHGWSGKPESFGLLPEALKKRFHSNPYLYPYPTSPFGASPALSFIARNLRNSILTHTSSNRVALIAHSMGGVIVRRMLANELIGRDTLLDRIKLVVFAASPKNGAGLAGLGKFVDSLSQDQLRDLSPNSGFMVDLNDHWREWVSRKVRTHAASLLYTGLQIAS